MAHTRSRKENYLAKALSKLPTLSEGHTSDLKVETPTERVWVSRVTGDVEVERYNEKEGRWELVENNDY